MGTEANMGKKGSARRRGRCMMVAVDVQREIDLGGVSSARAQQSMIQLWCAILNDC